VALGTDPRISVCIPTYNSARFLGAALESVLLQTERDFEVVVSDDASTDDTDEVVRSYEDRRIRYVRSRVNGGVAANRNRCLVLARAAYVAWLDADDVYREDMLERQAAVLDRYPNVGVVHASCTIIDEAGEPLPAWPRAFEHDTIECGEAALRELTVSNYIRAPTVMLRRRVYDRTGGYNETLRSSEDWELWMRAAVAADFAYTAEDLASYRYHGQSLTASAEASGDSIRMDAHAVKSFFRRHRADLQHAAALERRAVAALAFKAVARAGRLFAAGRRLSSAHALLGAIRIEPALLRAPETWTTLGSIASGSEYRHYVHSKALLRRLHRQFSGTRFATRNEKLAVVAPEWSEAMERAAAAITRVVPHGALVVSVDKNDPTLLERSGRRGWHFPDLRLHGGGYPPDDAAAATYLDDLRAQGAEYLVFPKTALWWLEHYEKFRGELDAVHSCAWNDGTCVIYKLAPLPLER